MAIGVRGVTKVSGMVIELAEFSVVAESAESFPAAFEQASVHLAAADGFRGARLTRSIESPQRFVLIVEWENLTDHTEGFRSSAAFTQWREIVGPFFAEPPRVEHVQVFGTA